MRSGRTVTSIVWSAKEISQVLSGDATIIIDDDEALS
jgi:hypothetical protein